MSGFQDYDSEEPVGAGHVPVQSIISELQKLMESRGMSTASPPFSLNFPTTSGCTSSANTFKGTYVYNFILSINWLTLVILCLFQIHLLVCKISFFYCCSPSVFLVKRYFMSMFLCLMLSRYNAGTDQDFLRGGLNNYSSRFLEQGVCTKVIKI